MALCVSEASIKFIFPFITGAILTSVVLFVFSESKSYSNCESGGTKLIIKNDTELNVKRFEIVTSYSQKFTCTLRYKYCELVLVNAGDMSLTINAITSDGNSLTGELSYVESCASRLITVSQLVATNT